MGAAGGGIMAGLGLYQAYGQAEGARAMGEYQNTMAEINSRNSEMQADGAIKRGKEAADNYKKKVNSLVGTQRVSYAAGGVDVGYGSAQEIQDETREIGARDIATIKNNAFLEAMGYKAESQNALRRGRIAQLGAKNESTNTLLTGGLSAARQLNDNYGSSLTTNKIKSTPKSEVA